MTEHTLPTSTPAVLLRQTGPAENLEFASIPLPEPSAGQVLVRHEAIGFNMIDTYFRRGLYPSSLPTVLGTEAAGVVVAVGESVDQFNVGDRVACYTITGAVGGGTYCRYRITPTEELVLIPDGIEFDVAAAVLLKGLTARYLIKQTWPVQSGETIVATAAAGGVGTLLCQWASAIGARVIGIVGSESKVTYALDHGCSDVLVRGRDNIPEAVSELTGGEGVPVVYDSLGRDSFFESLDCLRPRGLMVTYGNATGAVEPFSPLELSKRGSLFVTRPTLTDYLADDSSLSESAEDLFDAIRKGLLRVEIGARFPLEKVADVHRAAETGNTTGATILMP